MSIVIEKAGVKDDLVTVRVEAAADAAAAVMGVEAAWLAREAAEAAMGLGKIDPDFVETMPPVSFFLAESCSLVFTTCGPISFRLISTCADHPRHSPQIGFVPVLVMIPATIAAPK